MNLEIVISSENFDQILSGKKTSEFLEYSDNYIRQLCIIENDEIISFKPFKTVTFTTGNSKNSKKAIFKITNIWLTEFQNDIPEGLKKGDQLFEIEIGEQQHDK